MAFSTVDATWINAVSGSPSYTDTELRRADAAMFAGAGDTSDPLKVRGGIVRHASNSLAVTVDGSDVVTLQPGAVVIPGNDTASGGVYRTAQAAVETQSLAARDATNARIDLVIFEIIAGGTQARPRIITGTPSGSPAVPALPTRAVELARINVPAAGGPVSTVDSSTRLYAAATGGIIPCTSATRPAHLQGLVIVELDTDKILKSTGTAWRDLTPDYFTGNEGVIVGTQPPAGTKKIVKQGSAVTNVANTSGGFSFGWHDGAFPNGLVSVVVSIGDTSANTIASVVAVQGNMSLAGYNGVARQPNGSVTPNGTAIRIGYIAVGW